MITEKAKISYRFYPDFPRVGVGLVLLLNSKLILVKRSKEPAKGLWTLPGGLVELGETAREAAKREAKEELGLNIEIDSLLEVIDLIEKDQNEKVKIHYILLDYLAYVVSGQLHAGSDAEEIRTVGVSEIASLKMPALTRHFLQKNFAKLFLQG